MGLIKNFDFLAKTAKRKIVLEVIETGLQAIQPQNILQRQLVYQNNILTVGKEAVDLSLYDSVFLVGFGKGSAGISQIIEKTLNEKLTDGYVIDNVLKDFSKIHFTLGTHPLPSQQNIDFTEGVLSKLNNLTKKDLVLMIVCGGGSAMFEAPHVLSLEKITQVFGALLKSGADISEMNVIRKHLSKVKGGGFAKHIYPARVISLIFSDVPGNDLSVIASGPTVKDTSNLNDVQSILEKYDISSDVISSKDFTETPKEDMYFQNTSNNIMVSNNTALVAMQKKAQDHNIKTRIYSDRFQADAKEAGKILIEQTQNGEMLLMGGETTLKVIGTGKGGRNQTLVLSCLPYIDDNTVIASFDSDGIDFYYFAGALADKITIQKAQELGLDQTTYLDDDNSYEFFQKTGDGILTGKLPSNVSDLMVVAKI